jgi:hypothetical protein
MKKNKDLESENKTLNKIIDNLNSTNDKVNTETHNLVGHLKTQLDYKEKDYSRI